MPKNPSIVARVVDEFVQQEIRRRTYILQRALDLARELCRAGDASGDLAKRRREVQRLDRLNRAIEKVLEEHDTESYAALQKTVAQASASP